MENKQKSKTAFYSLRFNLKKLAKQTAEVNRIDEHRDWDVKEFISIKMPPRQGKKYAGVSAALSRFECIEKESSKPIKREKLTDKQSMGLMWILPMLKLS